MALVRTTFGPIQHPLLEHGVLGDERLGVYPDPVPDLDMMLKHGQRSDAHVIADIVQLPDVRLVPGLKIVADDGSRVDDGVTPDHGIVADDRFLAGVAFKRSADNAKIFYRDVPAHFYQRVYFCGFGDAVHFFPSRHF